MKNRYPILQRIALAFSLVFLMVFLLAQPGFSQSQNGIQKGLLRIKVSDDLATQIERARTTRTANNVLLTGIQSLDNVSQQFKVNAIQRVFRSAGKFEAKHRRYGLHLWYEVQMDQASSVVAALSAYRNIAQILIAEPIYEKAVIGANNKIFGPVVYNKNSLVPLDGPSNDPLLGAQWHYDNTGQTGGTPGSDISLIQAWALETGNSSVIVAVTDGGIQVDHPDLAANMWVNTDEVPGNGIDDDNNGYIDDINGYGFGDDTGDIFPDDHGTHVGGTVAAVTNNGIGVAGVAGGSGTGDGVRLMSCAAFGGTANGGFADTYTYAADNGAVISQNSWGYTLPGVFEQAVLDGIDYFIAEAGRDEEGNQVGPLNGGLVIFAAGNSDTNEQHYPGFYEATFAVSGVTHEDKKAWYSNFGPWVDIAAPGGETNTVAQEGVLSTLANNQYGFFQGTSMACPHVSGLAALIISKFGGPGSGLTPAMVRARITETSDDIDAADPSFAGLLGEGRINAFAALQEDDATPPEAVTDLSADAGITSVTLTWTAPADAGSGSASTYDIRYSTSPITEDNLDEATAVANPPSPAAAGTAQSFTVTGLTPGTTYFFAIKAADFFGNASAISNVVEETTNFAPEIAVSPTTLSATLATAETTTETLTILNNGEGPLDFTIEGAFAYATPDPVSGSVPAGGSLDVTVTFDAAGLLAGTYTEELFIVSNDPVTDTLTVPVTLTVISNGAPIASVSPDSIDLGGVFEGGSSSKTLSIHNAGAEVLIISDITSDNADFTTDFNDSLSVAPFETETVTVTYQASSLGVSTGTLTLETNDPANPTFTVALSGEGLEAPDIVVSPDSLYQELLTDHTATQALTVQNTGASDLVFTVEVSAGAAPAAVATVQHINIPAKSSGAVSTARKQSAGDIKRSPVVTIRSIRKSAVTTSVLILTPDSDVSDIETILDAFEDVDASVFPVASLPSITAADLAPFDIVFTTNNGQWLATGGVAPETIGDVLADYVDQGGKVIVNQFAYSYDAWQMAGRFIDEQYGPFTPATTDANVVTALGTILAPGHAVMEGVTTLDYSGYVQNVGLASGATALAEWANGELFAAVNGNVVALNMLPSLGNGDPLQWEGDLPTLYHNAIHYLGGPGYVTVAPMESTVAPGQQVELEVTFDATGLEGGLYPASINIINNVPNKELIAIPAVLKVLGPEFTVSPDSLYEELQKGETASQTFTLSNNGSGDYTYDITVEGKGVSSFSVQKKSASANVKSSAARIPTTPRTNQSAARVNVSLTGSKAIPSANTVARSSVSEGQMSTEQYSTDFESFTLGNINGQQGWSGQFGNWTVEEESAASGSQHFRGLADGFGLSLAFSPVVSIGAEDKSTATMKINLDGSDVTWQIIPQSPSAGFVNTRVQFGPDGTASALVADGGGTLLPISAPVPAGYFDLTIEVDRASSEFSVYFNEDKVFTGQGFTGDIEQLVILSLMEVAGPTLDLDDVTIIDGTNDFIPPYLTVSPQSGDLNAGESVEITVNFDATELGFGTYRSDIKVNIADVEQLTVATTLRVYGEPAIEVDPTVLQATVAYREDTVRTFDITNTGGNPLEYSIQVIGADTDVASLLPGPVSKFANWRSDERITGKVAEDTKLSRPAAEKLSTLEVLAGAPILTENFDGGTFPPSGWSVVDNAGTGVVWDFAASWGEGNYSGTGEAATVSSDAAGEAEYDAELISPWMSTAGYKNIAVQFNASYSNFANLDFLEVDVQVEGSSTWTNVLSWNEDHGTFRGTPGEYVTVALDDALGSAASFRLRWHYYDPNEGDWNWYAQIDDVVILGDARAWLSVNPASGTIPVRASQTIEALFDAEDIEAGFYVSGILVNSNASNAPLVGIVASLEVMEPAVISVEPGSLTQELFVGESATQTLTISNSGESPLNFSFEAVATAGASAVQKERILSTDTRTTPGAGTLKLDDRAAIVSPVSKYAGTELYATSFEEFAPGNINGQEGWSGQFGNWTVETDNPFTGAQHFRGLADSLGQSLAFSPLVAIGTEPISSTTMKIDVQGDGVTWQIIPQSTTAELVNTRFQISPDRTMQVLVDTAGGIFVPVPGSWPNGYAELRIDVERATSNFTIYIDDAPVFSGKGFAGDIEQVVVLSLMEDDGPTFDVDNLAIYDGEPQAPWLVVSPLSGVVPSGGSVTVDVTFNAEDLEAGVYTDTLNIASNDPVSPWTLVPVTLTVGANIPPVLADIADATVLEKQTLNVTFTATDEDDSLVTVTLQDLPDFITLTGSGNGYASYAIKPLVGDEGEYDLAVIAEDARGAMDVDTFHLSVIRFAVASFSVINTTTGEVIAEFTDQITLNRADAGFANWNIRANTTPETIGSVKFKVNGSQKNIDNANPYLLKANVLSGLGVGNHTLLGEPYMEASGHGQKGQSLQAVVTIINATTFVTDFSLVNTSTGEVVLNFDDSVTVDANHPDFANLNIRANTSPATVGSVKFKVNGSQRNIDNTNPYLLKSQALQLLAPGTHTLLAEPFSEASGHGVRGQGNTATVTIFNGAATAARMRTPGEAAGAEGIGSGITLYPVPVIDNLNFDVTRKIEGDVELMIINAQGQLVHRVRVSAEALKGYQINTIDLGLNSGIYYLKVQGTSGIRDTQKFMKK
ncbi:MAG TPA: S8 family serine peptidase [Ohtaekwangia sp.]|nr:S8 family serine peptidase [Ohtaekwangia sp.]